MTTKKNTLIGIALLVIFVVISSFEKEVSAQESERLFPCSDAPSEVRLMEIDGAVTSYAIVDKHQIAFNDSNDELLVCLTERERHGRDRQHDHYLSSYTDNGDVSGTCNVAALMWQKSPGIDDNGDIDAKDKMSYKNVVARPVTFNLGSYTDLHLPTIKERYALIDFISNVLNVHESTDTYSLIPFIGMSHFEFAYNDTGASECIIDAQYAPSKRYLASVAIGYGLLDNDDDTSTDRETDLIWSQIDSGSDLIREEAPSWEEEKNAGDYRDYMDSRLQNVKELQIIVDDIRSPDTTVTATINAMFNTTSILDEANQNNCLDSDFVNDLSSMDSTDFSFVSDEAIKQQQYSSSNFYNDGSAYDGMDSAFNINIFSIDTHANIGGITGKILETLGAGKNITASM